MQRLRGLIYPAITMVTLVVAVVVLSAVSFFFTWNPTIVLPWGNNAQAPLQGFYASETDNVGPYHWSNPDATIQFPRITTHPISLLQLVVSDSGRPVLLTIHSGTVEIKPTVAQQTRHIALLLPMRQSNADLTVTIHAPPFVSATDERPLGVRVRSVTITAVSAGFLALPWFGVIVWLALLISMSAWLCRAPTSVVWGSGVLLAPFLFGVAMVVNAGFATAWLTAWAIVLPVVPLLIAFLRWRRLQIPPLILCVLALWLLIRLVFVVYPAFEGHDYLIHAKRLVEFHHAQSLTLLDHPYEFNGRPGLVLPLFYWISDALAHVMGLNLAMHTVMVCAESLLGLVVWLILRQCHVSERTATLAVVLTLAMPIATTVLWWSFMPQVLAHLLAFLVIYATLRRDRWGAVLAGVALTGVVWTHIGEILIIAVWYVGVRVSESDRWSPAWWWRWLPVIVLPLSATSLYLNYIQTLMNAAPTSARTVPFHFANMLLQLKEGLAVGFAPIVWWLTPLLMFVAWRRLPRVAPAWGVTVLLWLSVELISGYQVRYVYLAVPLIAIGLAYSLAPLTRYGRAGWVFVATIVLFVTWVSLALWVDATLLGVHPRVDGLSH